MNKRFFTVKEINKYLKNLLSGDSLLSNLWIRGEVSNFKVHNSGHIYFTLKDDTSSIKCVMFRSQASRLKFTPTHGIEVLISGYISIYERDGQYQLYAEEMLPAGLGALHLAYEQLKERLTQEGLFAKNKRQLPPLPQKIGIVTSLTGAALRDILSIVKRRSPQTDIIIIPTLVQGADAPVAICKALDKAYSQKIDVIIIGRGGGSLEELWCFNDEQVVRKVSLSPVPIISAVGHETDFTLSDFAADHRAATPSAAAELAVPNREELKLKINENKTRLLILISNAIAQERQRLEYLLRNKIFQDPLIIVRDFHQEVDNLHSKLMLAQKTILDSQQKELKYLIGKLDSLSPLKTMARGYALCFSQSNQLLKSAKQVKTGEYIKVKFYEGQLDCEVKGKKEE